MSLITTKNTPPTAERHPLATVLIAVLWLVITPLAFAGKLDEQRFHYEMAKTELKKKDSIAFAKHYAHLDDYPLKIYLDYGVASQQLDDAKYSKAEAFLRAHEGSYLGDRLYRRYLFSLAKHKRDKDLIYWYKAQHASITTTCKWLEARLNKGDKTAFNEISQIWQQPKSQPKECDEVFERWLSSDAFDAHIAWQRFIGALQAKQRGLARYVASLLPEQYQPYVKTAWQLDSRPYRLAKTLRFTKDDAITRDLIRFGISRLAHNEPLKALQAWQNYEARIVFENSELRDTKIRLLKRLIRKKHLGEASSILVNSPSVRNQSVIEHLIREFLNEERWQDVLFAINLLPEPDQEKDRWQYWRARAESKLSIGSKEQHIAIYEHIAENRSFYGFLAADILNKLYSFDHVRQRYDETSLSLLASSPEIKRTKELWLQGHLSEAGAEWSYATRTMSAKELGQAGALADRWGWHEGAIRALIAGEHWNHLDERFPLAFSEHIQDAASAHRIQPELIFAIARQESAMSPNAKSSAGARGVMQLMPSTAKQTANKFGLKHKTTDLYLPEHNIQLGAAYLSELLEKYQGNRILAAAAYNAGPYRVENWRNNRRSKLDFDVWIETIPFNETRRYVKNVLTYSVIYSYRMGETGTLVSDSEAKLKL